MNYFQSNFNQNFIDKKKISDASHDPGFSLKSYLVFVESVKLKFNLSRHNQVNKFHSFENFMN